MKIKGQAWRCGRAALQFHEGCVFGHPVEQLLDVKQQARHNLGKDLTCDWTKMPRDLIKSM
jgi:hypothetical protein